MEWQHNKYRIKAKISPNNKLFEVTEIYYKGKKIYSNGKQMPKEFKKQLTLF
jgi:hypothetical protein